MAESLFTTQTPTTQTSESNPGPTLGTVIVVAVAGQITHGRWRFPNTLPSNAVPFVLYDATTQAELARATFASPAAGAWNTVALPAPVNVTAGQRLVAAIRTADQYAFTGGFFTSSGVTNGNLSAPATGNDPIGNGRFRTNLDAYPSSTFNGNCYFVDVVFEAGGGGGAVQGVATASLGGLSATAAGDRTVNGTATASLGGLTSSAAGDRTVNGAAAATLGALTAAAAGDRRVSGTATAGLGALSANVVGQRTIHGTLAASLGGLTATASGEGASPAVTGTGQAPLGALTATAAGRRTVRALATADLGALAATVAGLRTVHGHATGSLGGLTATATVGFATTGTGPRIVSRSAPSRITSQTIGGHL